MSFASDFRPLMRYAGFRRLLGVRLVSQCSDGIFQVALAGAVVFSPEKAPNASAIAAAFAAILLPFSILGPFAGVFLDRWPRRRVFILGSLARCFLVLVTAMLDRTGELGPPFFLTVLCVFSVNRFVAAGFSASMPHVVTPDRLVTANALTPTCGTLSYLAGFGLGTLVRWWTNDLVVLLVASCGYFLAAAAATRLPFLGPETDAASREVRAAVKHVVSGLADAIRHTNSRARLALTMVAVTRLPFGLMTTALVLFARSDGPGGHAGHGAGGLAGFGATAAASGVGFAIAMFTVPSMTTRWSIPKTVVLLLGVAAVVVVFPSTLFTRWAIAVGALGVGLASQGVKICIDTLLQSLVDDFFLGRVFAVYDVVFNVSLVAAAAFAAMVLPPSGKSTVVMIGAGLWYVLWMFLFTLGWRRTDPAADPDPPLITSRAT